MKKFTLLIASLFITIGAMAQTPVLELTSEQIGTSYPYELTDEDAQKVYALTDLTVVVKMNTAAMENRMALFCTSDPTATANSSAMPTNSAYIAYGTSGANISYLASCVTGDRYSGGTVPANSEDVVLAYVLNPTNTNFKAYINGTSVMDRDFGSYEIATPAMVKADHANAKIYIGGGKTSDGSRETFNGAITGVKVYDGVLTADEIANAFPVELPEGFVATPEEFVNGKVYTFVTQRGAMGASETSSNAISTARETADTETDYFKWTVYKSAKGNFYLYNLGKAMFLGEMSTTGNASVPMSETPVAVTFKTTSITTHPIMFTTMNDGSCVANHSSDYGEGLITWNGGWDKLTDTGNGHQVVAVAELDAEILSTVEAAVNAFEADNTEAVAELDEAIDKAIELSAFIGTGVGKYSYTGDGDYQEKFAAITAFRDGITATNTPTPEEVAAKTAELNALLSSFVLNMPENGEYYRLKGAESGYYATSNMCANESYTNKLAMEQDGTTAVSIWYLSENNAFLSYVKGQYLGNFAKSGGTWSFENVGSTGNSVVFADGGTIGKYQIKPSSGRALYGDGIRVDAADENNNSGHYNWILEEVTELPVTITSAGYATLYAPVALTVPSEVKAYTVTINGEWATLNEIEGGVIPANTGVIIAGANGEAATAGTYNFAITTSEETLESDLRGSAPATYYTEPGTYYALAQVDGVVGFYKDEFNNSRFQNNSHKAYLYIAAEAAASAASYSFRFGEGTTGIDEIADNRVQSTVIYDLTGRRVETITEPGIYIVGGKKVLVK